MNLSDSYWFNCTDPIMVMSMLKIIANEVIYIVDTGHHASAFHPLQFRMAYSGVNFFLLFTLEKLKKIQNVFTPECCYALPPRLSYLLVTLPK